MRSGSLSADFMDPETSTRKTRLAAGRSSSSKVLPLSPTRTSLWPGFQGQAAASTWTAKGSPPEGGA